MKATLLRLIRLFPAAFRREFGPAMADHIARDHEAARARGRGAALRHTAAAAFDLVRAALAERWDPTLARPTLHPPAQSRDTMGHITEWLRELRLAYRNLRRSPGFAAVAVGTLGLAIGANAGMFSVVNRVVLDPLPFPEPGRLMAVSGTAPGSQLPPEFGLAAEFYFEYRNQSQLVEDVAILGSGTSTLRVGDRVERIPMAWPTSSLYSTLGVKPILGRLPVPEDEGRVCVISYTLWQTWFGGDSSVIGKTYDVSYGRRQVVGVMGPDFHFPDDRTLLWNSADMREADVVPGRLGGRMVVRAKPGVTPEALASEFTALAKRLPERFGGPANYATLIGQFRAVVRPLKTEMLGSASEALWVLLAAVTIVLIIACANVANLILVRTEGRHREMAIRQAIGAGRGDLIRVQLAEAVVLAVAAGAVAVVLAWITLPLMLLAAPSTVPRIGAVHVDLSTILYTAGLAMLAALACGLFPAIRASSPDLLRLREGGWGSTRHRHWARSGLVIGQTALALVLLIGSGLLLRSYDKLRRVDPGYDTRDVFTFQFAPEQPGLQDGADWANFHLAFLDRLRALPGVTSVGIVENVPLDEGTGITPFEAEGQVADPDNTTRLNYTFAGPGYFETMRIPVLAGRGYDRADVTTDFGGAVISQRAAEALWPGQPLRNAIGRRFKASGDSVWSTVIGVVHDVMQDDFRHPPDPLVYYPLRDADPKAYRLTSPGYVVRTPRAEVIAPEILALVHEAAPEAPMYRTYTMEFLARRSMTELSFTMLTLGVVASLALILGVVGVYGVLSYIVAERTREIGVRMALGAQAGQVLRMVVAQGARVVGAGAVIGIAVALASTRALGGLLYGVAAFDLPTFAATSTSLVAVGLLASYMPARRASNVDPIESLRGDG
ncbi:MAG: ABC transporter permease [Gemmatimonadales bacterium]